MNNNENFNGSVPPRRRRRPGMSTKHKVIIAVILVLYTALLSTVTYFMFYKPKVNDNRFIEYVTDEEGNTIEITHDYTAVEGIFNILVLGHDKNAMLTDVCMIMNINNNDDKVTVMQIPRDTYIRSVDGVYSHTNKINETFIDHYNYYRGQGEDDEKAYTHSLEAMADLLADTLCINIDFAAIMDLAGFRNIVDAIGGVRMNVPVPLEYNDPVQGLTINIPAGEQVLNGAQAEGFVRFREGYSTADLGRQNAQKMFVTAFFNTLKENISVTDVSKITTIAGEVIGNLETNLGVNDIVYFARSALTLDLGNINMMTMPGNVANGYYVMNRAATLNLINKYYNTFDKDITDGVFDGREQFLNSSSSYMSDVYYADADNVYDGNIYVGDDVNENQIDIPLTPEYQDAISGK